MLNVFKDDLIVIQKPYHIIIKLILYENLKKILMRH